MIWLDNATAARSETYSDVNIRGTDEAGQVIDSRVLGRYLDRWEKRDGTWRISNRVFVLDLDQTAPAAGCIYQTTGKRDRTDPSYFGML
jgi:hypothetical protein